MFNVTTIETVGNCLRQSLQKHRIRESGHKGLKKRSFMSLGISHKLLWTYWEHPSNSVNLSVDTGIGARSAFGSPS